MAYTYYNISCTNGGNYLNLYGSGAVTDHRNVTMYSTLSSNDQKWGVNGLTGKQQVFSGSNTAFALNAKRVGTNWNCDVLKAATNLTDSQVMFESAGSTNTYYIRLANYSNRYLTAASSNSGADVYWAAKSTTANQKWKLTKTSAPSGGGGTVTPPPSGSVTNNGPHSIAMPCACNQKADPNDTWFYNKGCAVCCAVMAASFYAGKVLTKRDIPYKEGAYDWNTPYVAYDRHANVSESKFFELIRQGIDAKHPVVICITLPKDTSSTHFVIAYGYTGNGNSRDNILVIDPVGGELRTLTEAGHVSRVNGVDKSHIDTIRLTSKKP